jgi:hypothetical protein
VLQSKHHACQQQPPHCPISSREFSRLDANTPTVVAKVVALKWPRGARPIAAAKAQKNKARSTKAAGQQRPEPEARARSQQSAIGKSAIACRVGNLRSALLIKYIGNRDPSFMARGSSFGFLQHQSTAGEQQQHQQQHGVSTGPF